MKQEFMDTMYSMSLYPLITKQITLIGNIFTNSMENSLVSGLMINDITDHLLVLVIHDCDCGKEKKTIQSNTGH